MENLIDWNISRQIVWGIPIPAKICDACDTGYVDLENKITKCEKCKGDVRQDNDTFDTWFSSGQWPYATLGYPDGKDFKTFYPTNVMETAGDIFHWVARMIMLSLYRTNVLPFKTVYMHGMVLDGKGQKMSKSKGNVINPLDLTAKYGTDAFRIGLVIGNTPGTSLALSEDKISTYKKFANKLWNITRFVLESTSEEKLKISNNKSEIDDLKADDLVAADVTHLKTLTDLMKEITGEMEEYKFYLVADKLYHYAWHEFADKILEESKKVFSEGDEKSKRSRAMFLQYALRTILKSLHPFMPYVTEEIWQLMNSGYTKGASTLLMVEKWPNSSR